MAKHSIVKRKDGRHAVRLKGGRYLSGDDKIKVLSEAGLIKAAIAKPKAEEAPAAEAPAEGE